MTDNAPWLAARPFPDDDYRHALVVAAHPGDAPLSLGGLLQRLDERGTAIELVVATGAAQDTLVDSLHAQGLSAVKVHTLGLPYSRLVEHRAELAERLTERLADADVCFVPWPGDPHTDHATIGDIALRVAPRTAHRWSYPVGTWPEDLAVPRSHVFVHRLDRRQWQRKVAGLATFAGPDQDVEIVFREPPTRSAPVDRFAELYDTTADPWDVTTKWYERRKRAVVLACLPDERYGSAVEPACGNGALTTALAERCGRVVAFDPVPAAVRAARDRTAHLPSVRITRGALPVDLPPGPVDLVVFGEILYYLDDTDLISTVDRAVGALRPGGHLVAVHWLHWAAEAPRDGMAAHRFLLADARLDQLVEHVDEEFVLHVLGRR